ncbi:hypothetical protein NCAS_0I00180 [Naumovozyma castellii]|uniref:Uncharacterized protein n=1 Tax=Naumovozyma castellii TaxID=27288 RepID=G0VJK6_NAUCA|nr:hypothetical protein NCAS_0I00180 [Naumovozyma castellii CBS 4309]CCC71686.1 hypothetical protein NCAS_0I00180 [Naumovozyma castellii CBS 4309]
MNSNNTNANSDSFDYILQLTKVLTAECRASRQETDKIELNLQRIAKQVGLSYEQLTNKVNQEVQERYSETINETAKDEKERLIIENYQLIYQIEQAEYLKKRVWNLIKNINDHILSIKNFITQQRMNSLQDFDNFMFDNFENVERQLDDNIVNLDESNDITKENIALALEKLQKTMDGIDWTMVPRDSHHIQSLKRKLESFEQLYGISLNKSF